MRSKAHIGAHPIHPILVAFPIAFFFGAIVFDIVGRAMNWPSWWVTGSYLNVAGILCGLVAGVPGLIDYLLVVPPGSSGKRRATWHMLVNVSSIACFAVAWWLRSGTLMPGAASIALEVLGIVLVSSGGWLGGTLVYRNQIGVDHRYAGAGKWREETIDARPGQTVTVAKADELKVDQMKLLHVGEKRVVLARTEQGYSAFDDHCTHRGGSLADGVLINGCVECPWHGSQFDVHTGALRSGPAQESISAYRVEQVDGEVRLTV